MAAFLFALVGCVDAPSSRTATHPSSPAVKSSNLRGVARIKNDAQRLEPLVKSEQVKQFLRQTALLPSITPRKLFAPPDKSKYYTGTDVFRNNIDLPSPLVTHDVDEDKYYNTNFGSPLSYSRPLDVLFAHGFELPLGSKMLDFGYGYIGHLRMLATMGMHTTGVDVWPLLPVLYSFPGDQGEVRGLQGETGSIRLVDGRFPADADVVSAIGNGYRLVISKNVLKKGYIHPDRPVDNPKKLIDLGASDEVVLRSFHAALEPGGFFLIYNICPALTPPDKPFVPWSDGRSPFTKAQFDAAGFEVLEFDKDDTEAVRIMGKALGWDQPADGEPGMDLDQDLSVLYTVVRKRA